jgi:hypothetical protein
VRQPLLGDRQQAARLAAVPAGGLQPLHLHPQPRARRLGVADRGLEVQERARPRLQEVPRIGHKNSPADGRETDRRCLAFRPASRSARPGRTQGYP